MTNELLPCPFCGGIGKIYSRYINGIANTKHYWIRCGKCQTIQQERRSAKRAAEAWNNRVEAVE